MKKTKFIWILCLCIFTLSLFTGCSDDDESEREGFGIVGTWEYEQPDGEYIDRFQFKANGTFIETEKEYYSNGKWETVKNEGTYEFDGDNLFLRYQDYYGNGKEIAITYTIMELSSKRLELSDRYSKTKTYKRI